MNRVVLVGLLENVLLLTGLPPAVAQSQHTRNQNVSEPRNFLDKLVTDEMTADHVLGVSIIVVKDGHPWYERGFGFEDERKTRPVDPQTTEFFAASVSKLFVATAVMQLAEQGRLDLHRDINQYLDFRLDPFHDSRPITLTDLLTHTAGVDDHMIGAESPIRQPVELGAYFQKHIPALIREPGSEIDYSNQGVALAARIVERVSDMSFYDYAESQILEPLQMRHSTFRQPVPGPFQSHLGSERFEKPYTILYPVATLVTTASDMGKFMLAHLKGAPPQSHMLSDTALDAMHAQHFAPSAELPGVTYGFFEAQDAGGRGLFHAGARDHFSLLYLLPENNLGIYIVMCGASEASQLPSHVVREFLQHLFGPKNPPIRGEPSAAVPEWLPGRYRLDAISHSTLEKLIGLGAEMQVRGSGNDIDVTIPSFSRGVSTEKYRQVAALLFQAQSGAALQFRRLARSQQVKAFRSDFVSDPMSFTRLHWYESSTVFLSTIVLSYALFVAFLLLAGYWLIRRQTAREQRLLWGLGAVLSVCAIGAPTIGILLAVLAREHQLYTIERILRIVMLIFHPTIVLAAVVLALTPSVLIGNWWPIRQRIAYAALGSASAFFLRFVLYWHLWGWEF